MDLEKLYHIQISAMADEIKGHVENGDLHRAALTAAACCSTLATMMTIVRFEQGVAHERAQRAALDAAERDGRESAADLVRRMDGVQ